MAEAREDDLDFYISYAGQGQDRRWAEWIAGQLRQADYTVELDVWSWLPGENIILARESALRRARRVVAVCSDAYFGGGYSEQEWTAVMATRHREAGRLIPVWIEDLAEDRLPDLLRSVQPIKLTEAVSAEEASKRLLAGLSGQLGPEMVPPFPGNGSSRRRAAKRHQDELPGSEAPDIWRVPPRNRDFTGRDAVLIQVREALLSGSPGIAILQGPGGVGKTQLSTEYAHRFATDYDTVWVIDAEQAGLVASQLADLATAMGLPTLGAAQAATAVTNALRSQTRWLLVFDNVEDPDDIMGFLPDGPGHVLVTARPGSWDEVGTRIVVEEFSRAESTALLTSRVSGLPGQDADAIAEALGDLPLALAQAAGTLRAGLSAAEFRRLLDSQATLVLSRGKPRSYRESLAAATLVACDKLAAADPKAANLLTLCGYLAPELIPADWFYTAPRSTDTATADVRELPDGPLAVTDAFERIRNFGLGRVDQQGLKLHRLTQAVLRDHTAGREDWYRAQVIAMLAAVAPGDTSDPVHWTRWATLVPHLLTVPVEPAPASFRPLACAAARYLIASGQPKAALAMVERLHAIWTAQLGPDHPDTLTAAELWGVALHETGAYARSLEISRDTYDRRRRVHGEDDRATLAAANDVAISLGTLGREDEALPISRDVYARRCRVLGAEDPQSLHSGCNLGATLIDLGRPMEALPILQDVYEKQRRVLGSDHLNTMLSANNLAGALSAVGRAREALSLGREVLERRRRVVGDDHPYTLNAAEGLSFILLKAGQLTEAISLVREVLAKRRQVLGDDHPDTLNATANLSSMLTAAGRGREGLKDARNAHEKLALLLGEDNPRTLNALGGLIGALAGAGRWNEALPLINDFMARHRRVLGEDHSASLQIESTFGLFLLTTGRPREAHPYNQDVYERRTRVLGEDHPETMHATEVLAANLEALGRRAEAIRLRHGKPKGPQKR